jgi:hypothetical protein
MNSHKQSWLSTILARVEKVVMRSRAKQTRSPAPSEINPLPEDRAFNREENIEFLKHHYPKREYQQSPPPALQSEKEEQKIDKDKPLHGFHGG